MINLKPIEDHIAQLEKQLESPVPTPPIGTPVVWFRCADPGARVAAMVTQIEGPGKLKLVTFTPFRNEEHKQGVLHVSNPLHKNRHNTVSASSGSWDYPEGVRPPKAHFEMHIEELMTRKGQLETSLAEAKVIQAKEAQTV